MLRSIALSGRSAKGAVARCGHSEARSAPSDSRAQFWQAATGVAGLRPLCSRADVLLIHCREALEVLESVLDVKGIAGESLTVELQRLAERKTEKPRQANWL